MLEIWREVEDDLDLLERNQFQALSAVIVVGGYAEFTCQSWS
jgi:hypothetical protein